MTRDDIPLARIANGASTGLDSVPSYSPGELVRITRDCLALGLRISAYFAATAEGGTELFALLADDSGGSLFLGRARAEGSFPSMAADFPQAQLFEREIYEQYGLEPEGHPWLKAVRRAPGLGESGLDGAMSGFYAVGGEQVHEVAVGPVHAGVIEPGHFRFQCHGERVLHLEIALGYQHRGIEEALMGGPDARSIHFAETAAGDETMAHVSSYCQVVEALQGGRSPARAQALAAVALELERLACHCGDLGALSGDVGFLPTASFCGRIRGDFLNMTALLCGNRFGRGLVVPGGLRLDVDDARLAELERRLEAAWRDADAAIRLLWDSQSVMARFEDTGRLSREAALDLGIVGPAARASGLARDLRFDLSSGIYRMAHLPVATCDSGDVLGRAIVRYLEMQRSVAFVREMLEGLPGGPSRDPRGGDASCALSPRSVAAALTEGWRGEACHVAITDGKGRFARYKIIDPSFHNWPALAYVLRDQGISDFPLCNKSFNLSYCGHDL